MPKARHSATLVPISLAIALALFQSASAANLRQVGDNLSISGANQQVLPGATVDIVSTDGTVKVQGTTSADGNLCVIGQDNVTATQGRPECLYLPDGEYRLFVGDEQPVRFAVNEGVINVVSDPTATTEPASRGRTALIAGAGIALVAGLAGGGGGGSSDDEEPDGSVAVSVSPNMLSGSFEFGVTPCPSVVGDLTVTNTGEVEARITTVPIAGLSTTGQGQLLEPGDSGTVTVLFDCLVISAIAGSIQVGLINDGQTDSKSIEVVVNFL